MNNDAIFDENDIEHTKRNYLGTFRWKKLKLSKFKKINFDEICDKFEDIINIDTFKSLLELRIIENEDLNTDNKEELNIIHPSTIDGLSYPYSIIQIIKNFINEGKISIEDIFKNLDYNTKGNFNIILLGASKRAEERIALESNYFDEIYYVFLSLIANYYISTKVDKNINSITKEVIKKIFCKFKLNIIFTGEEIETNTGFKTSENFNLSFFPMKTEEFLKSYMLVFDKENTLLVGMNCGFGAGYSKLTLSWVKDLNLILKLKYITGFTFTNDYEDFKGEKLIMKYS